MTSHQFLFLDKLRQIFCLPTDKLFILFHDYWATMQIDDNRFGRIVVNGREYTTDVIIFPDHVESDWWRKSGHDLCLEDLSSVFDFRPTLLIVGTGHYGRMKVLPETTARLKEAGCELVERKTMEACELYNARREEDGVVACLHLTC